MASRKACHERFRRRQTHQHSGHEIPSGSSGRRTGLDVPARGHVDRCHGDGGGREGGDDGREGIAERTGIGEAEEGVEDLVGLLEGVGEVGCEWDGEVVELCC